MIATVPHFLVWPRALEASQNMNRSQLQPLTDATRHNGTFQLCHSAQGNGLAHRRKPARSCAWLGAAGPMQLPCKLLGSKPMAQANRAQKWDDVSQSYDARATCRCCHQTFATRSVQFKRLDNTKPSTQACRLPTFTPHSMPSDIQQRLSPKMPAHARRSAKALECMINCRMCTSRPGSQYAQASCAGRAGKIALTACLV